MIRAWRPSERGWPLIRCELPDPGLADDDVLVAVEASVIGTPERAPAPGLTPGGAAVGVVADAGPSAAHLLQKRVAFGPDMACGECDACRRSAVAACPHGATLGRTVDGALASAVVARARWACVLDDGLDLPGPAAALVGREAAWAYSMLVRAGVGPGEPVIIAGHDVVARFLVDIAVAKGTRPLVAVAGAQPAWSAWIDARGGVAVPLEPGAPASQTAEALRSAAGAAGHGERPGCIFVTGAAAEDRGLALAAMRPGSRLVLLARRALGLPDRGPLLDIDAVADADGTLVGVAGAHPDLLPEVAALAVRGELDLAGAAEVVPAALLTGSVDSLPAAAELPRALLVEPGT